MMKTSAMGFLFVIHLTASAQISGDVSLDYGRDEIQIFEREGSEIAYLDTGSGDPMLFIHGAFSDYRVWMHQTEAFRSERRVISYSNRTSYPNPPSQDTVLAKQMAWDETSDAIALLDFFNIDSAVLVAHSAGGGVAINMALQRPDLVQALVLVEPAVIVMPPVTETSGSSGVFFPLPMIEAFTKIEIGEVEAGVRQFLDFASGPGYFDSQSPNAQRIIIDNAYSGMVGTGPAPGRAHVLPTLPPNYCEIVSDLAMPVLYVAGEVSPQPDTISHCFSSAQKITVEGASHGVFFEEPAEFNRVLQSFLRGL